MVDLEIIFIFGPQGYFCCIIVYRQQLWSFSNTRKFMCKYSSQGREFLKGHYWRSWGDRVELLQCGDLGNIARSCCLKPVSGLWIWDWWRVRLLGKLYLWIRAVEVQFLPVHLTFFFPNHWLLSQLGISWPLPVPGHLASNSTMATQVQVKNFQTLVTLTSQSQPLVHMSGNPGFQHERIP